VKTVGYLAAQAVRNKKNMFSFSLADI